MPIPLAGAPGPQQDEVGLTDDACQPTVIVDDRECADAVPAQQVGGVLEGRLMEDRYGIPRHEVTDQRSPR